MQDACPPVSSSGGPQIVYIPVKPHVEWQGRQCWKTVTDALPGLYYLTSFLLRTFKRLDGSRGRRVNCRKVSRFVPWHLTVKILKTDSVQNGFFYIPAAATATQDRNQGKGASATDRAKQLEVTKAVQQYCSTRCLDKCGYVSRVSVQLQISKIDQLYCVDQDPVPEDKQTWTSWTFITYWYSDLVTISTWTAASSIMTTGLTATDAILIVLVAAICNAIPTVLNGAIGSELHIPFPIVVRASYGYWLSYFAVLSRGILALFWFGVQSANGGGCVKQVSLSFMDMCFHERSLLSITDPHRHLA